MNTKAPLQTSDDVIVQIIRDAMEFIRKHEKDANVCLGYAWGTMNAILDAHGAATERAPWENPPNLQVSP